MTTFVLVHGGFAGGWIWADIAERLEKAGHRVEVVDQLPSTVPAVFGDLAADADAVRRTVEAVGEPVVLVGHSYGGMVITELAGHPSVAHSVYVAACHPQRGESVMSIFTAAGVPLDWGVANDERSLRFVDDLEAVRRIYCGDLELAQVEPGLRRMVPHSLSSLTGASTAPARTHPFTYVIAELDGVLPVAVQEQMATGAARVERLPSAHAPMWSVPEELAEVLGRAGQ